MEQIINSENYEKTGERRARKPRDLFNIDTKLPSEENM
jgi:hypothetical protein